MSNIYKKLTKFAGEQAERRGVDKQVFVWAVICFCDFIRKQGYTIVHTGKKKKKNGKNTTNLPKPSAKI